MPVHELRPSPSTAIARQLRFLLRLAALIPRLLAELESGHVESEQRLGRRRLRDGRIAELWIVVRAPRRDETPLVRGRE